MARLNVSKGSPAGSAVAHKNTINNVHALFGLEKIPCRQYSITDNVN
jgi:hypothetical protein